MGRFDRYFILKEIDGRMNLDGLGRSFAVYIALSQRGEARDGCFNSACRAVRIRRFQT
jgi:hypothetical protein